MNLLHYSKLRLLVERKDEKGVPIPFSMKYVTMDGEIIDEDGCICTSVDPYYKRRNIRFKSGITRTIRDVLILQINDIKIRIN